MGESPLFICSEALAGFDGIWLVFLPVVDDWMSGLAAYVQVSGIRYQVSGTGYRQAYSRDFSLWQFRWTQFGAPAERVAASHHLEVVDVEFQGGAKFRTLRVFIEKNAAERAKLAAAAEAGEVEDLPKGVPVELLSGVTHEDCATFAQDFGTVLDVEDLIPGAEYTLEVSSPGLERKLYRGGGLCAVYREAW